MDIVHMHLDRLCVTGEKGLAQWHALYYVGPRTSSGKSAVIRPDSICPKRCHGLHLGEHE